MEIQNNYLSKDYSGKLDRLNIVMNMALLTGFIVLQLYFLLSGNPSINLNLEKQIYSIGLVLSGIIFLIIRMFPKVHSVRFYWYWLLLFFLIIIYLNISSMPESVPPIEYNIWIAPWFEESTRFINFVIWYDIFRTGCKKSSRWSKIYAFGIAHLTFYLLHYGAEIPLWSLSAILSWGLIFGILAIHLGLMGNYLLPLLLHGLYNYFNGTAANPIHPIFWYLILPSIISIPFYLMVRKVLKKKYDKTHSWI